MRVRIWADSAEKWFGITGEHGCLGVPDQHELREEESGGILIPFEPGIIVGYPGWEFPLPEGADPQTHNLGRPYNDCNLSEYQIETLQSLEDAGVPRVHVTRSGTFDGPEYPFPDENDLI
jgi:hypothetical protein